MHAARDRDRTRLVGGRPRARARVLRMSPRSRVSTEHAEPVAAASLRTPHRRQSGQALVEFALVLPIFVILGLGVVDGARIFNGYTAVTNASREAAVYAAAGHLSKWCRNPGNAAQKAATPPVSVA